MAAWAVIDDKGNIYPGSVGMSPSQSKERFIKEHLFSMQLEFANRWLTGNRYKIEEIDLVRKVDAKYYEPESV